MNISSPCTFGPIHPFFCNEPNPSPAIREWWGEDTIPWCEDVHWQTRVINITSSCRKAYICTYVCMYVCMYVCTYVRMYVVCTTRDGEFCMHVYMLCIGSYTFIRAGRSCPWILPRRSDESQPSSLPPMSLHRHDIAKHRYSPPRAPFLHTRSVDPL